MWSTGVIQIGTTAGAAARTITRTTSAVSTLAATNSGRTRLIGSRSRAYAVERFHPIRPNPVPADNAVRQIAGSA
jgi:hypothetical protein